MLTVEIWSDLVCPWCYLGRLRWQKALERFPHADEVTVRWRAFELRPDHRRIQGDLLADLMVTNYGMPKPDIDAVFDRIRRLGADEGVVLRPEGVRPVNSFDAHRLSRLAWTDGAGDAMDERLFRAYHTELLNIADRDVLQELAAGVGLADDDVVSLLGGDRFADEIRAEEAGARHAGVTSVPSFVVDGRQIIHGAVDSDAMLAMLVEEWEKRRPVAGLSTPPVT
ncbi:DsbA family oxidoreductase [Streptomyces sp. NPDC026589]|uniref:DsbA family oxidoreductase n=1 Tax=Streptomyces sp. NPDC026589 TaxID=3155609 RepID=UPI0033D2EE60